MSATGYGIGAALSGFGQAYNAARLRKTQMEVDQRNKLASTLLTLYPNAKPDAQADIAQRILSIYSTPAHKKLDQKIGDISTLGQAQAGAAAQASQASMQANAPNLNRTAETIQSQTPDQITGQLPAPPPTAAPSTTGAPPASPTSAMDVRAPVPAPAAASTYSAWYTPEERAQLAAKQAEMAASGTTTGQLEAHMAAFDQFRQSHPGATMQDYLAATGRSIPYGMVRPVTTGHNISGADFTAAHPDAQTTSGEEIDPKSFYNAVQIGGVTYAEPAGLGANQVQSTINRNEGNVPSSPFNAFRLAHPEMNLQQVTDAWNTTTNHGYRMVPQPDGSIQAVPVTTVTSKGGHGGGTVPSPPSGGATVGGKIPPEESKQRVIYNDAITRYNVMSDALPKALAGDQQAMINLLYNHIGMTIGLQKGARITRDIINEAQQSAPWMATLLARIGEGEGFTMTPELLRGVVIPPQTMQNMLGLAEGRIGEEYRKLNDIRSMYKGGSAPTPESVIAGGQARQKGLPPPPNGSKTVMMLAPDGKTRKPVPSEQVEHYKSLGATVVQ